MDIKFDFSTTVGGNAGWELTDLAICYHKDSPDADGPFLFAGLTFETADHILKTSAGPADTAAELQDQIEAVKQRMADFKGLPLIDMNYEWIVKANIEAADDDDD